MRRLVRHWRAALSLAVAGALLLTFVASAVLTESALHPLIRRRASDTATLAYNVAQMARASAEHVTIRTRDNVLLDAWWLVPSQFDGRAVMVCHGVADSAYGALGYGMLFLRRGYAVLMPESRGHGESGGFVSYGVIESGDILEWLAWMKAHRVTEPLGFGESLGGAILIGSLALGAEFRALVVESSYSSFVKVADERVGHVTGTPIAKLFVRAGMAYARLRYGVSLWNARPDAAIRSAHVPVLLIHGTADDETGCEHSVKLERANRMWTRLWLVPNARHTGAYATEPEEFEKRVIGWFRKGQIRNGSAQSDMVEASALSH